MNANRSVFQSSSTSVNRQMSLKIIDKYVSETHYLPVNIKIMVCDMKGINLVNVYKYRTVVENLNKAFYDDERDSKTLMDRLLSFVKRADYSL